MNTKEELERDVKQYAAELNAVVAGRWYVCPECGGAIEVDDAENDGEPLECCGETCELQTMADYLGDPLDMSYIVGRDGTYEHGRVYTTVGGPTIWINTEAACVRGTWGSEETTANITYAARDAIDDILADWYDAVK
jgi:hypothetical protein